PRTIPDLSTGGLTYDQAAAKLSSLGLAPTGQSVYSDSVPAGQVVATSPATGQQVARGATVTVQVSKGPHLVSMPNVYGQLGGQAVAALHAAGLHVQVYGPDPNGKVIYTDPQPQATVHFGATVSVFVL
ncbi:MAG: PASTA domain-containing protein, partial [Acidimicrobiales bacterium]